MHEPRLPVREISARQKEALCLAWASERGYPLPKKPGCFLTVVGILGLFAAIVPGLLCLWLANKREQDYKREMRDLLMRWADAWEDARLDEIEDYKEYLAHRQQRYLESRYEDLEDNY